MNLSRVRRLERNLRIIAEVIAQGDTKYWDIYDRLDGELRAIKKRQKRLRKTLNEVE